MTDGEIMKAVRLTAEWTGQIMAEFARQVLPVMQVVAAALVDVGRVAEAATAEERERQRQEGGCPL